MRHLGFKAWITSHDRILPEFEEHKVGNRAICWIPGKPGNRFTIHWADSGSGIDSVAYIQLDGLIAPGRFLRGVGWSFRTGIRSGPQEERPFVFQNVSDDEIDSLQDRRKWDKQVGTIVLRIKQVRLIGPRAPNKIQDLPLRTSAGPKDLRVGFGPGVQSFEQYPTTWTTQPYDKNKPGTFVAFIFRYRSCDFLVSQGIMPSNHPSRISSPRTSAVSSLSDDPDNADDGSTEITQFLPPNFGNGDSPLPSTSNLRLIPDYEQTDAARTEYQRRASLPDAGSVYRNQISRSISFSPGQSSVPLSWCPHPLYPPMELPSAEPGRDPTSFSSYPGTQDKGKQRAASPHQEPPAWIAPHEGRTNEATYEELYDDLYLDPPSVGPVDASLRDSSAQRTSSWVATIQNSPSVDVSFQTEPSWGMLSQYSSSVEIHEPQPMPHGTAGLVPSSWRVHSPHVSLDSAPGQHPPSGEMPPDSAPVWGFPARGLPVPDGPSQDTSNWRTPTQRSYSWSGPAPAPPAWVDTFQNAPPEDAAAQSMSWENTLAAWQGPTQDTTTWETRTQHGTSWDSYAHSKSSWDASSLRASRDVSAPGTSAWDASDRGESRDESTLGPSPTDASAHRGSWDTGAQRSNLSHYDEPWVSSAHGARTQDASARGTSEWPAPAPETSTSSLAFWDASAQRQSMQGVFGHGHGTSWNPSAHGAPSWDASTPCAIPSSGPAQEASTPSSFAQTQDTCFWNVSTGSGAPDDSAGPSWASQG